MLDTADIVRDRDVTTAILGGYVFDKRAQYGFTVWTSTWAASIVVAGNIGWRFSEGLHWCSGHPVTRCHVSIFHVNR